MLSLREKVAIAMYGGYRARCMESAELSGVAFEPWPLWEDLGDFQQDWLERANDAVSVLEELPLRG